MLTHYLRTAALPSWPGLFKSAETVAFFIKYLNREDLPRAHAAFEALAASDTVRAMLAAVRADYVAPIVSSDKLSLEAGGAVIARAIDEIEALAGRSTAPLKMLARLTAAWMRNRLEVVSVPMAPRNVQSVLFLLAARWLSSRGHGGGALGVGGGGAVTAANSRALIAQVGTGEGKSLIIAMLSCYAVLALGKRVHVLENNVGLLERDFADFSSFYTSLGVSTAKRDFDADASVVYALRSDIEHAYRDRVFAGTVPPFPDTVLIVDEVDQLIVDGSPNQAYVKPDAERSAGLSNALDAAAAGLRTAPSCVAADLWQRALKAHAEATALRENEPGGFARVGRRAVLLDSHGRHTESWTPALEALNYRLFGAAPRWLTVFVVQSMPHILSKYDAILGLSGSLGSPAERDYLRVTFRALFVEVPSFLNTCRDVVKLPPALIDNTVAVHKTEAAQREAVVRLAGEHSASAPVVIIAASPQHAARTFTELERSAVGARAQLFLEKNPADGTRMDWSALVERATQPIEGARGARTWRVTVTDYFGGRGHDFRINDEDVDAAGGLVVIATSIPENEREWLQWKGRTARNDRRGRYAVVLCAADAPVNSSGELLAAHRPLPPPPPPPHITPPPRPPPPPPAHAHTPELIAALLELRDGATREKLVNLGSNVRRGQRLSELCDAFYARYGGGGSWPAGEKHVALRDFLESCDCVTAADIANFAARVGLAASSDAWAAASIYAGEWAKA